MINYAETFNALLDDLKSWRRPLMQRVTMSMVGEIQKLNKLMVRLKPLHVSVHENPSLNKKAERFREFCVNQDKGSVWQLTSIVKKVISFRMICLKAIVNQPNPDACKAMGRYLNMNFR